MKPRFYLSAGVWCALLAGLLCAQARPRPVPPTRRATRPPASVTQTPSAPANGATSPALSRPYLSGTAEVTLDSETTAVVRLGVARAAVTVVEFPAADNFFALHPGSAGLIALEDSPTLASDHYLVLRAGPEFPAGATAPPNVPQTAVAVQMQSGLVVTLLVYAAPDVAQATQRCVIRYTPADIKTQRRAAGLAVNLAGGGENVPVPPVTAWRVARSTPANQTEKAVAPEVTPRGAEAATLEDSSGAALMAEIAAWPTAARPVRPVNPVTAAQQALHAALAAPAKFSVWSAPVQGLSLALLPPTELAERRLLTVLAIRNTTSQSLRLVAAPVWETVTQDERGQSVLAQAVPVVHQAETSSGGVVPAGATIYYAFVLDAPVLGVRQRLRVSAAHTAAADAPASTSLSR